MNIARIGVFVWFLNPNSNKLVKIKVNGSGIKGSVHLVGWKGNYYQIPWSTGRDSGSPVRTAMFALQFFWQPVKLNVCYSVFSCANWSFRRPNQKFTVSRQFIFSENLIPNAKISFKNYIFIFFLSKYLSPCLVWGGAWYRSNSIWLDFLAPINNVSDMNSIIIFSKIWQC